MARVGISFKSFFPVLYLIGSCYTKQSSHLIESRASGNLSVPKLVFAHFIAGLTINYTRTDWEDQISLAASHGIDAFALNVGLPASWQVSQVSTAYEVAEQTSTPSGQGFKLFLSLDMSVIQSASDVTTWVTQFSVKDSQLNINGRPLISTFSGEDNKLGGANLSAGWQAAVKDPLLALNPPVNALFVPAWTSLNPTTAVTNNPVVDGIMSWKSWPTGSEVMTTFVDTQFQTDAKKAGKLYMAGVSPCFFTHYSDKNYIFRSDNNLYITRWQELIAMPTQPDLIEIISWNDYGESHYIGPMAGTPPNGTTWIHGFDHQAWLYMSDYFINWYKTGSPPAISEDILYFQYRPHSVSAVASSDPLGPPANATVSTDAVYAAAFLSPSSKASQLQIGIGDVEYTFNNLKPGSISTYTAPWNHSEGAVVVSVLDSAGKPMMNGMAKERIANNISTYNFNYVSEGLTQQGLLSNNNSNSRKPSSKANSANGAIQVPKWAVAAACVLSLHHWLRG